MPSYPNPESNNRSFGSTDAAVVTTDAFVSVYSLDVSGSLHGAVQITNGHAANSIDCKVDGSFDGGATWPAAVAASAAIANAAAAPRVVEWTGKAYTNIRVQVKSTGAGVPGSATVVVNAVG